MEILLFLLVLIFSVVLHEVSHGAVADRLGDPTAKLAGRLTLNPLPHIDLFGSILIPIFLIITTLGVPGGPYTFGWAKPVPVNPYNLRHKYGSALVSFAGPGSNLAIAVVFALLLRFLPVIEVSVGLYNAFVTVVILNVVLALFNLLPIPPLDGSHILFNFLPPSKRHIQVFLEQNGFYILLGILLLNFITNGLIFGLLFGGVIDLVFRVFIGI